MCVCICMHVCMLYVCVNIYCSVVDGVIWGVLVESTLQLGSFDCFI